MIRVHVICEGQTEEAFIHAVMSAPFALKGVELRPALIGRPGHKGGNITVERLFRDVRNRLLQDTTAWCTSLVDFYGLPADFPGKQAARRLSTCRDKARCVQDAVVAHFLEHLDADPLRRFFPYVQMHEFEGLLFSDPDVLAREIGRQALARSFRDIRAAFPSPEDINDDAMKAPSKRIQQIIPNYEKVLMGPLAARAMGLDVIRQECPLFQEWVSRIEALGAGGAS